MITQEESPVKTEPRFKLGERLVGCGCAGVLACFLLAVMLSAMMGDYIGPAEHKPAAERSRRNRILGSLVGVTLSTGVGIWLLIARRTKPETTEL